MKTLEQYFTLYPNSSRHKEWLVDHSNGYNNGTVIFEYGMLEFTEETAYNWAGPFDGNHAFFIIRDFTNTISPTYKAKTDKNLLKCLDKEEKAKEHKAIRNGLRYNKPYNVSLEFPIEFYITGNDDYSLFKFYKTKEQAMEDYSLFISNEPLDFKTSKDFEFGVK